MSATSTITDNAINHDHDGCRASITQPTVRLATREQPHARTSHFASGNRLFDCAQPAAVKTLSFQFSPSKTLFSRPTFYEKCPFFTPISRFSTSSFPRKQRSFLYTRHVLDPVLFHSFHSRCDLAKTTNQALISDCLRSSTTSNRAPSNRAPSTQAMRRSPLLPGDY